MPSKEFQRFGMGRGIHCTVCLDDKFKTNRISVYFLLPLTEKTAAANAVLACLLTKNCRTYPTITAFSQRLDHLYGADLYGDVLKIGESQALLFTAECMDDRYAMEQEDLTAEITDLLMDAILDPVLQDNCFPDASFALEKQFLLDSALAELNNKRSYAMRQFSRLMFEGEAGSVDKLGSVEKISALHKEEAFAAWQKMLRSAKIEVLFTGCGHAEAAVSVLNKRLSALERGPVARFGSKRHIPAETVRRGEEAMEVQQAKLVMGYALAEDPEEKRGVLRVLNCLLGGSPGSRFFLNIREKQSLCYYCPSRINGQKGYLIADSGVEMENAQKVEAAVEHEISQMQQNGCTDEELATAKRYLQTAFRSVSDSSSSMESWNLNRILFGNLSLKKEGEAVQKVTKEQIQAAACRLKKDTVFLLSAKEVEA